MKKKTKLVMPATFSRYPAGRFKSDGPYSGEAFRDDHLFPRLQEGVTVVVCLDGTLGYGSSFLEEAFGGLVRIHKLSLSFLNDHLSFETTDSSLVKEIWGYITDASKQGVPA